MQEELGDDIDNMLENFIGEDYLRKISGVDDLSTVNHLKLSFDSSIQSVQSIHTFLPSLQSLVLDGSILSTVRDLGTGFRNLLMVSLNECGLTDIDGISVLSGMTELSLKGNLISEVSPLAMHDNIKTLYLSDNKICDFSIADALSSCPKLRSLFLSGNLICSTRNFRPVLSSLMPNLEMLDGTPVDRSIAVSNGMILDAVSTMNLALEELEDEQRMEMLIMTDTHSEPIATRLDTGSELTHGDNTAMAGGLAVALRSRRNRMKAAETADESAISALDSGLSHYKQHDNSRTRQPGIVSSTDAVPFFAEGDVTAAVTGQDSSRCNLVIDTDVDAIEEMKIDYTTQRPSTASGGSRPLSSSRLVPPAHSQSPSRPPISSGRPPTRGGASSISFGGAEEGQVSCSWESGAVVPDRASRPGSRMGSGKVKIGSHSREAECRPSSSLGSPRQMNYSRPQTNDSNTSMSSISDGGGEDGQDGTARLFSRGAAPFLISTKNGTMWEDSNRSQPVKKSPERSSRRRGAESDESSDEDDISRSHKLSSKSTMKDSSKTTSSQSIVHKDIVWRSREEISKQDASVCSRVRLDAEGIAINHEARIRLMSSSTARRTIPAAAAANGRSVASCEEEEEEEDGDDNSRSTRNCGLGPLHSTASSAAGRSLGFDLAGSLAAIGQWVESMESDDEEGSLAATTSNSKGSRLDKDKGAAASNTKGASFTARPDSGNSSTPAQQDTRILSRDSILSMCSQSESKPQVLVIEHDDDDVNDDKESLSSRSPRAEDSTGWCPSDRPSSSRPQSASRRGRGNNHSEAVSNSTLSSSVPSHSLGSKVKASRSSLLTIGGSHDRNKSKLTAKDRLGGQGLKIDTSSIKRPIADDDDDDGALEELLGGDLFAVPLSSPTTEQRHQRGMEGDQPSGAIFGDGVFMNDKDLVELLRLPPKSTPALRTKSSFQEFFRGIRAARIKHLLELAYGEHSSAEERASKVKKRMDLLCDVVT